ncbi:MAG: hypothetical protein HY259_10305, partial [Chloroflexi bacterium]|nr:hypothetical protein [Chloroflexota bacterium]
GRALRMMLAAGAGVPLHMLGDPDTTARATAGDATRGMLSHYRTRQLELIEMVSEVIERAALRAQAAGRLVMPRGGLQLQAQVQELTREDNLLLAQAAEAIVKALEAARANGWVDDATAQALMLKFAGESATVSMTDPKGF